MKKTYCIILAVLLMAAASLSGFSGCGSVPEQQMKEQTKDTEKYSPMTIKIYRPGVTVGNSQAVFDKLGELTNTKPIFLESAWDYWLDKVALMITTGEDVQWVNVDAVQPYNQWGKGGFLWDLAPILKAHKDELKVLYSIAFSDTFRPYRGPEGEVYGIPAISYLQNNGIRMRKDILDQLGLPLPGTTEEIYQALKKIKESEILPKGGYPIYTGGLGRFQWAFYAYGGDIFTTITDPPRYYKEGDVFKSYDISGMNREALKFIRRLHREDLVNSDLPAPSKVNVDVDSFRKGLSAFFYGSEGFEREMYDEHPEFIIAWLDAPEGPTGICNYNGNIPSYLLNTIPKCVKDPYEVLKFIEFMHTREARLLCSFGIEGVHYEVNENGEIDRNAYMNKLKEDFKDISGGYCPVFWGYVSPYFGYLDMDKYPRFEDALRNIRRFKQVPEKPKDERYSEWVEHCEKWGTKPYPYHGWSIDGLKAVAPKLNEFTLSFYMKAIIAKDFDIDKEWPGFVEKYYENGGQEAQDAFTKFAKEHDF